MVEEPGMKVAKATTVPFSSVRPDPILAPVFWICEMLLGHLKLYLSYLP